MYQHYYSKTTVCIASLGRPSLIPLIRSLSIISNWKLRFCVSLPSDAPITVIEELEHFVNTTVSYVRGKHQVTQRNDAIKHSDRDLILQLDDDVTLSRPSIEKLYDAFDTLPEKSVIGPALQWSDNTSFFKPKFQTEKSILRQLINAIEKRILGISRGSTALMIYGKVTKSGVPIGFPSGLVNSSFQSYEVDFLSGCCMLLRREHALESSYYPWTTGRASLEDLFHCFYLKKKFDCKLFIAKESTVIIQAQDSSAKSISSSTRELMQTALKHLYFNYIYKFNISRLLIWYTCTVLYRGVGLLLSKA